MGWFRRILSRQRRSGVFGPVPAWGRPRLRDACRRLSDQEEAMRELFGLPVAPRLMLADEELAVLIDAEERRAIEGDG
ncbi:hypothetical protein [Azospirillum soli]|uniref:hypothetical protein n=1 Tax=Azospirillum soli TaxID=1304799 RepID=UPI001AEA8C52|nr:hypothetical protein [Azospirillum soli]MBP2315375.1 hypothetical protein [Azospirillum soli]